MSTLEISIRIAAPMAKVWKGLTDPAEIKKYLFGTDTLTDWKVGSPITFTGLWEGKTYQDKGTVLRFEPNKVLTYSYFSSFSGLEDKPESYQNVTYTLSPDGSGTLFSLMQDNIPTEESKAHSESNWKGILEVFKKQMEDN